MYSTYLGGAGDDEAFDIAVDRRGRPMIVGETDGDFAVTEFGYNFTFGGRKDAFVAMLHLVLNGMAKRQKHELDKATMKLENLLTLRRQG